MGHTRWCHHSGHGLFRGRGIAQSSHAFDLVGGRVAKRVPHLGLCPKQSGINPPSRDGILLEESSAISKDFPDNIFHNVRLASLGLGGKVIWDFGSNQFSEYPVSDMIETGSPPTTENIRVTRTWNGNTGNSRHSNKAPVSTLVLSPLTTVAWGVALQDVMDWWCFLWLFVSIPWWWWWSWCRLCRFVLDWWYLSCWFILDNKRFLLCRIFLDRQSLSWPFVLGRRFLLCRSA